jgi:hypothetical protein
VSNNQSVYALDTGGNIVDKGINIANAYKPVSIDPQFTGYKPEQIYYISISKRAKEIYQSYMKLVITCG